MFVLFQQNFAEILWQKETKLPLHTHRPPHTPPISCWNERYACTLIHPLIHSPAHPITCSPAHPLTHYPTQLLTCSPAHLRTYAPTPCPTIHPLTHSLPHPQSPPTHSLSPHSGNLSHSNSHALTHLIIEFFIKFPIHNVCFVSAKFCWNIKAKRNITPTPHTQTPPHPTHLLLKWEVCMYLNLIHPLIHSPAHPITCSPAHPLTHYPTQLLTCSPAHLCTHPIPNHSPPHSLTPSFTIPSHPLTLSSLR